MTDPTAFKPSVKPPLDLDVEVELVDGSTITQHADARQPGRRPFGQEFGTQRGDGFATASYGLNRPILRNYKDVNLLDTTRFVGKQGDVAYEGRLHSDPRGNDPAPQINLNLVGVMGSYMRGRRCRPLIVDRRHPSWTGPSLEERARQIGFGRTLFDATTEAGGLALRWVGRLLNGVDPVSNMWFDAGAENRIGDIYYEFTIPNSSAGYAISGDPAASLDFWGLDDDHGGGGVSLTGNLRAAAGSGYVKPSTLKRFALLNWYYANTGESAGGQGEEYTALFKALAAVGDHGLTNRGGSGPPCFWLSDIARDILARYRPKVRWADTNPANTYPVGQATWHDNPADSYEILQQLNDLALWETNMWENWELHFEPADLTRYDWLIRTDDPGVKVLFQGDSIEAFANGAEVTFTEYGGRQVTLYPADHPELRDEREENPANRQGEEMWVPVPVPYECFLEEALQYGRAYLGEYNRPKRPGQYRLQSGYIKDFANHWQQGWKVRNSMTLGIGDHPDDHPRLIYASNWRTDGSLDITVDAPKKQLDAIVARKARAREGANLT